MVLAVGYAGSFSARFRACTESTSLLQVPQSSSRGRRLAAAATSGTTTSRTSSWQQTWVRPQPAACCPVLGCCRQRITMAADLVKPHTLGLCMEHTLLRMQRSFAAVPDCVAACCPAAVLGREPHNNLCLAVCCSLCSEGAQPPRKPSCGSARAPRQKPLPCVSWPMPSCNYAFAGANAFRLSLEWSRIMPRQGVIDESAIRRYHQIFDCIER